MMELSDFVDSLDSDQHLEHHGVKGMKWGQRKAKKSSGGKSKQSGGERVKGGLSTKAKIAIGVGVGVAAATGAQTVRAAAQSRVSTAGINRDYRDFLATQRRYFTGKVSPEQYKNLAANIGIHMASSRRSSHRSIFEPGAVSVYSPEGPTFRGPEALQEYLANSRQNVYPH